MHKHRRMGKHYFYSFLLTFYHYTIYSSQQLISLYLHKSANSKGRSEGINVRFYLVPIAFSFRLLLANIDQFFSSRPFATVSRHWPQHSFCQLLHIFRNSGCVKLPGTNCVGRVLRSDSMAVTSMLHANLDRTHMSTEDGKNKRKIWY